MAKNGVIVNIAEVKFPIKGSFLIYVNKTKYQKYKVKKIQQL